MRLLLGSRGQVGTVGNFAAGAVGSRRGQHGHRYPCREMKRYHLTTFGCQMNEHDSERMKGMLEAARLRRGAGARGGGPDPLQHLLDPRDRGQPLHHPSRRGQAAEARTARARRGRRRLLGAVGQGGGVRALPVRGRRVRARPGPQARRVPHERLAHARRATSSSRASPGTCRRAARAPSRAGCRSASAATAAAPTASCPRRAGARSAARSQELVEEVAAMAADGVKEVTLLGQNVNSYGRDLPPSAGQKPTLRAPARRCSTGSRGSSASATRARTRRTCART